MLNTSSALRRIVRSLPLSLLFAFGGFTTQPSLAPIAGDPVQLPSGWMKVAGGDDTECALGTPFWFYVHLGNPRRLMVYFQGGGACWDGVTCDVEARPTFDPSIDEADEPRATGIGDLTSAENPVRDYTIVYVPYCTGDTHLGARTVSYTSGARSRSPGRTFAVHHVGALNAMGAMRWAFENVRDPQVVFVTGSSAGAIASPVFAVVAARHYKRARIVQLGDAGGGYRASNIPELLSQAGVAPWLQSEVGFRSVDSTTLNHTTLYTMAARSAPRAIFAEYNNVEDSVQIGFQRLLGVRDMSLRQSLAENIADIRVGLPQLHTYTAPGFTHTILTRPQFYTLTVDDVRFRDWLTALLDGKPLPDVGTKLLEGNP